MDEVGVFWKKRVVRAFLTEKITCVKIERFERSYTRKCKKLEVFRTK